MGDMRARRGWTGRNGRGGMGVHGYLNGKGKSLVSVWRIKNNREMDRIEMRARDRA
jgi:hypothetical protein